LLFRILIFYGMLRILQKLLGSLFCTIFARLHRDNLLL